jgi:xanthine dehydrogenase YagS FAD-binding subunit
MAKDGGSAVIGAGVKLAEIAATLRERFPALAGAAAQIGGPQIRNMGTLGGNLCQRNRCWYFRDEQTLCLLKGGKKCFATDGENRYHAIFTQGHPCVIVNPSTLAPALIALGATAEVLGPKGKRTIEMAKFFRAPKSAGEREHVLEPNEVLLSVAVPGQIGKNTANASYEVRHKQSYDWPLVQAAVAFTPKDGKASDVRIVLGHVAPTPVVAKEAAEAIEGKEVTEETAAKAGEAAAKGAKPLGQNAYKVKLVEVAVKRALLTAAGAKKYWEV